ncbi:hypothetical protein ACB092_11G248200 [Castanea dentata]
MAIAIYSIVFLGIKLGPQNAAYLPLFKFVCVTCAILSCELLGSILVNPLKLLIINICGFLAELIRRSLYKIIYELLYPATDDMVPWIQHASQAFKRFSLFGSTKKQDQDDIV